MLSFVIHGNVPTAVVMVVKRSIKAHGPVVLFIFYSRIYMIYNIPGLHEIVTLYAVYTLY